MKGRFIGIAAIIATSLMLLANTAQADTMDYVGAWNSTTIYAVGKVVSYNRIT